MSAEADRLYRLLSGLRDLATRSLPPETAEVSPALVAILDALAEGRAQRVSELARVLGKSRPTVSVEVKKLELQGLLRREADATDRRSKRLVLTPKGRALHRTIAEARRKTLSKALSALSPEERRTLFLLLEKATKGGSV